MAFYVNPLDKDGECATMGTLAEDLFYKILKTRGEVRKATTRENKSHCDLFLTVGNKITSYDVKSMKKVSRNDSDTSGELVWVEWSGIYGGLGWLMMGADFIVFEQAHSFIIINRIKLKNLCEKLCDMTSLVKSSKDALYKCYQRHGRNDLISLIKTSDILSSADEIVNKI